MVKYRINKSNWRNKLEKNYFAFSLDVDDNTTITWYNIFIEDFLNKDVLIAEPLPGRRDDTPFDVCCIYPAVDNARTIEIETVGTEQLPKESIKNIKCLVDTNDDNDPDLVIADARDGEYTITRYYIKENNIWSLFKQDNPM